MKDLWKDIRPVLGPAMLLFLGCLVVGMVVTLGVVVLMGGLP